MCIIVQWTPDTHRQWSFKAHQLSRVANLVSEHQAMFRLVFGRMTSEFFWKCNPPTPVFTGAIHLELLLITTFQRVRLRKNVASRTTSHSSDTWLSLMLAFWAELVSRKSSSHLEVSSSDASDSSRQRSRPDTRKFLR